MKMQFHFRSFWSLWLFGLICVLSMGIELLNDRFWLSDFEVYYRTANRLLSGENLYRIASDDFYVFKYSPVAAIPFIPFTIFSLAVAKVVYWLTVSFAFLYSLVKTLEVSSGKRISEISRVNVLIFFLGASVFIHIFRELHLGQVNFLLFICYLTVFRKMLENKLVSASICLALTLFYKPFGLIFLPYFFLHRNFRIIGYTGTSSLILFSLPLLFYRSFDIFSSQYTAWLNELVIELLNKKDLLQDGNHTIFSLVFRHLHLDVLIDQASFGMYYSLTLLIIIAVAVYLFVRKGFQSKVVLTMVPEFAMLLTLIPLLSFTSRNAFIFNMLSIAVLLSTFSKLPLWSRVFVGLAMLFIGGNNIELLGPDLTYFLEDISIVSIGSVMLLIALFVQRFQSERQ